MPANSTSYMREYMRKRQSKPKFLEEDAKRHRDRYGYEKKNGAIPDGKELDHVNGVSSDEVRVISKELNRERGMNKANKRMGRSYSKKLA